MSSAALEPRWAVSVGRPDSPPLAVTVHVAGDERHATPPHDTFSAGATLSMPIVAGCQSVTLPALAVTRVSNRGEPWAEIVTDDVEPEAPATRHSTFFTPEMASEPVTVVVKFVLRQPDVTPAVVFTGLVRSIFTVSSRQA